jgi:hypothetical protein
VKAILVVALGSALNAFFLAQGIFAQQTKPVSATGFKQTVPNTTPAPQPTPDEIYDPG